MTNATKKKLKKLCSKLDVKLIFGENEKVKEDLSKLYRMPNILVQSEIDQAKAVPAIESCYIPNDQYQTVMSELDHVFTQLSCRYVSWYEVVTGTARFLPYLDLRQLGQRQKLTRLIEQIKNTVVKHGGSVGIQGGGRQTAKYHREAHGDVLFEVMEKLKKLFDPYNILNPGVKFGVDEKALASKMIQGYSHGHRHNHLPK